MQDLHPEFISILNDKLSGSKELLNKINNFILEHTELIVKDNKYFELLEKEFTTFEAIQKYVQELLHFKDSDTLRKFAQSFYAEEESLYSSIYMNAKKYLLQHNSFLTLSNSKTLVEIFKRTAIDKPNIQVTVSESRPKNEGVIMSGKLAELGIKVHLITEAQIAWALSNCDCLILGADKILANGDVVNKTGSLTAAICAKELNKPVYVLADKSKRTDSNTFYPEEYPASEIYSGKESLIHVTNYYFERVDKTYITNIITD